MAAEMLAADLAITSAGRTVYEAATTGTPVVVLAANAREATHAHLGPETGVVFLGSARSSTASSIVPVVRRMLADYKLRSESQHPPAEVDRRPRRGSASHTKSAHC